MLIFLGILFSSIVIWFASETIAKVSDVIGRGWSKGVRGATINAVSSSLPELFAVGFFLVVLGDSDGFVFGLATMAGSSIFNALVIPMVMGVIAITHLKDKAPYHDRSIIVRDGLWLVACQLIVFAFIRYGSIGSWAGFALLIVYSLYVYSLNKVRKSAGEDIPPLPKRIRRKAYRNLSIAIVVVGVACYGLVEACVLLGTGMGWSIPVLGLLVAASATSVPDTFLSARDAWRGKPDDGISNALGSNIFDLCVALGLPVLLYGLLHGPINFTPETIQGLTVLWIGVMSLTLISITCMLTDRKLGILQVIAMGVSYAVFAAFVLKGGFSLG
jgi:Ca2+/Na+ antiporter